MTEPMSPHETEVPPEPPGPAAAPADGLEPISAYLVANGDRYTAEALGARLVDAGHNPDLVWAALRRRRGKGDVRKSARLAVVVAYGVTYLVFAISLFGANAYSFGAGAVTILTVVLGLALWISLWWIGRRGTGMGFAALVVVPAVQLVLVGGVCATTARLL